MGTATLDEFEEDLRPYARRAEKDYFGGRLAAENWYRVGMWFDTVDDQYESASNPDPTMHEKKVRQTPKVTRPKTNVNTPGPRDSKPASFQELPTQQPTLSEIAARVQRRYEHFVNASHNQIPTDPVIKRPNQPTDAGNTNEWEEMARNIGNPPGLQTQAGANQRTGGTSVQSPKLADSRRNQDSAEIAELKAQLRELQQQMNDLREQKTAESLALGSDQESFPRS